MDFNYNGFLSNHWSDCMINVEKFASNLYLEDVLYKQDSNRKKLNLLDDDNSNSPDDDTISITVGNCVPMEIEICDNSLDIEYYNEDILKNEIDFNLTEEISVDIMELMIFPSATQLVNLTSIGDAYNISAFDILEKSNFPASITDYHSNQFNGVTLEQSINPQVVPDIDTLNTQVVGDNPPDHICTSQKIKSKRGRPPGFKAKSLHLWEFIADLLENENPCIKWLNKELLIFRIENTKKIADLWGQAKKKPLMNYSYFTRAIRHCRNQGDFATIPDELEFPKKRCYRFGEQVHHRLKKTE